MIKDKLMPHFGRTAAVVLALSAIGLLGTLSPSPPLRAQENSQDKCEESIVERGLRISPVPLKLEGRDRDLVGLGSYLVNATGDCNGCHSSNVPPSYLYPYVNGRNPYFSQPQKIDPTV